jgi:hypothetical protein
MRTRWTGCGLKAEEASGNVDQEGAAMNMGRAGLMAKILAKTHHDENVAAVSLFQGAEALSRSQELGYRAMALFRRVGGQLPASSGVCGSLALAHSSVQQKVSTLDYEDNVPGPLAARAIQLLEEATDWVTVFDSMIVDYQCQQPRMIPLFFLNPLQD